ncbi:hypothetical protein [uncultured Fusobacterium sp.]|uniref:hypothetical protein n=1 Tax=uncultured Fusobacterium sp. TaxID=159267 RepID=UPI0025D74D3A|nr:hypothetical protein [uncultured Fusobacterium sp.]
MIFYDDFLKKLESTNYNLQDVEKFSAEGKKLVVGLGVGIPLLLIALFQIYMAKFDESIVRIGFGAIFLYIGFKQLKTVFSYKIKIDIKNRKMFFINVTLNLDEIESCTLKEGRVGKNLEPLLDIITLDKKQYIIPLYMNNKLKFVYCIKSILKDKFIIKK